MQRQQRDFDPLILFGQRRSSSAQKLCALCPVSEECLEAALTRKELWGIWGGQLIENGRIVIGKRGRGRPPKEPRPVVEVNEVPVPPELIPA